MLLADRTAVSSCEVRPSMMLARSSTNDITVKTHMPASETPISVAIFFLKLKDSSMPAPVDGSMNTTQQALLRLPISTSRMGD